MTTIDRMRRPVCACCRAAAWYRPSFNCATSRRAVERAICSDEELARLDRDMSAAFRSALATLDRREAAALRQSQQKFVSKRNRMFGQPEYQLRMEMERRLTQLFAIGR